MAYSLGNVKPAVRAVANKVGPMFGIKTIYGYSYRNVGGTSTLSDHATGRALDFMCGLDTGKRLAAYMQDNARQYGVTYIIHNRKIWSVARASEGWRPYTGVSPHTDHVHVSFTGGGGSGNPSPVGSSGSSAGGGTKNVGLDLTPWDGLLPDPRGLLNAPKDAASALVSIAKIVALFLNKNTWIRVFLFGVGMWALAIGIGIMVKNTRAVEAAGSSIKTAVKTAATAKAK